MVHLLCPLKTFHINSLQLTLCGREAASVLALAYNTEIDSIESDPGHERSS